MTVLPNHRMQRMGANRSDYSQFPCHWRLVPTADAGRYPGGAALARFVCLLAAALTLECGAADTSNALPTIVVRQYADYPGAGRGSRFPAGLIAALWSDGRLIRATGSNTIGISYVEGIVSGADRVKFVAFFNRSSALRNQEAEGEQIRIHAAYQLVTVRREGRQSQWVRPLPDRKAGFCELEERLWSLPLQKQHRIDWLAVRRASWYE